MTDYLSEEGRAAYAMNSAAHYWRTNRETLRVTKLRIEALRTELAALEGRLPGLVADYEAAKRKYDQAAESWLHQGFKIPEKKQGQDVQA